MLPGRPQDIVHTAQGAENLERFCPFAITKQNQFVGVKRLSKDCGNLEYPGFASIEVHQSCLNDSIDDLGHIPFEIPDDAIAFSLTGARRETVEDQSNIFIDE